MRQIVKRASIIRDAWWDEAACAGMDTNVFFGERAGTNNIALRICRDCPVMFDCRAATDRDEKGLRRDRIRGIFGGELPHQRIGRRAQRVRS